MKSRFITTALFIATTILALAGCKKPVAEPEIAAPTIEWAANPDFAPVEIAENMNIDIVIKAEAGIQSFVVSVDSHAISPIIKLFTTDGSARMDLINDTKLTGMFAAFGIGLPSGSELKDRTEVVFSLSTLVPMIADLSGQRDHDTNHIFTLDMTDNENRTLSKSLTFHYSYVE